jgi:molybdopterin-guanine dinucleotide biosynthesis protein B
MTQQVLGVVGWSGSGKTTLLEFLVANLVAEGKKVNVIKHSHHDVTLEPPHKDTARFRQAGAAEVLLASPFRYAIVHELTNQAEPSLEDLLLKLSPADIVLVEGYKWANVAKLEVYRPSLGKSAIYEEDAFICAVASDMERPSNCPERIKWLNLNQQESIYHWLLQRLSERN